jgi:hypothetical protein
MQTKKQLSKPDPVAKQVTGEGCPGASCSVWIVVGETGEYSDHSEWNVAGFTSEALATHFRDLCQNEADKVNGKDYTLRRGFKHAYDTQYYCDYTGTGYRVEMVEVFSSSPPNKRLWRGD